MAATAPRGWRACVLLVTALVVAGVGFHENVPARVLPPSAAAASAVRASATAHEKVVTFSATLHRSILEMNSVAQFLVVPEAASACNATSHFCPPLWPGVPAAAMPSAETVDVVFDVTIHDAPLVVAPLATCVGNAWHALVEFVFPLLHTTARADGGLLLAAAESDNQRRVPRPWLMLSVPRGSMWGSENKGCPFYRTHPFGINAASSPGGAIVERFYERAFFYPRDLVPVTRTGADPQRGVNVHVQFATTHVGLDRTCAAFPSMSTWPFYLPDDISASDHPCLAVQRYALSQLTLGGGQVLDRSEHLLVVLRRSHRNGRLVLNAEEVLQRISKELFCQVVRFDGEAAGRRQQQASPTRVASLRKNATTRCIAVAIYFEGISTQLQREWVAWATTLVTARGAASVYAGLLRRGGAFVSLFPAHRAAVDDPPPEISVAADNFPWWPLPYHRHDLAIGFVPCATATANSSAGRSYLFASARQRKNCLQRSPNYCDMVCDAEEVVRAVRRATSAEPTAVGLQLPELCGGYYCRLLPQQRREAHQ